MVSSVSKTLQLGNYNFNVQLGVRQAFNGKEMAVVHVQNQQITTFFKSFKDWIQENADNLLQGKDIDPKSVVIHFDSDKAAGDKRTLAELSLERKRSKS